MTHPPLSRRDALKTLVQLAALAAGGSAALARATSSPQNGYAEEFDVRKFGAVGDGKTLDTAAIQKAVDAAAAAGGGRVVISPGLTFLCGSLKLQSKIDFHLGEGATLRASSSQEDYDATAALLTADGADGLILSGTGAIDGHSLDFMTHYDEVGEWWQPKEFRPRMAVLAGCKNLLVRDLTFLDAPSWTLHLVGCDPGVGRWD